MQMASSGAASGLGTRSSAPFTPIARQTSIYSLTLDELQNNYEGKNFGSMNMDEFLKNIWTAEESQAMASALASTNETNNPKPSGSSAASGGGLGRQGSLSRQVSLPGALSRKTVDEVWKDIQRGSQVKPKELQPQASYGEMTLEDFLVKAGVVRDESEETEAATSAAPAADGPSRASASFPFGPGSVTAGAFQEAGPLARASHQATMDAIAAHNHQQSWLNYQLKATQMQQHHFLQQQQQAAAEAAAAAYENAKRGGLPLVAMPGTSSGSGVDGSSDGGLGHGNGLALSPTTNTQDSPSRGKKRNRDDVVEKTVERRQRRMIKNRESAARSRARKQAYTVELEAEVTQLKEENTRLKTQQMLVKLIPITEPSPPKKVLRRTKTNPW